MYKNEHKKLFLTRFTSLHCFTVQTLTLHCKMIEPAHSEPDERLN